MCVFVLFLECSKPASYKYLCVSVCVCDISGVLKSKSDTAHASEKKHTHTYYTHAREFLTRSVKVKPCKIRAVYCVSASSRQLVECVCVLCGRWQKPTSSPRQHRVYALFCVCQACYNVLRNTFAMRACFVCPVVNSQRVCGEYMCVFLPDYCRTS